MLSEDLIQIVEAFIAKNEPTKNNDIKSGISCNDLLYGKNMYNQINLKDSPDLEKFGSNAFGYTCYSLYNSVSGQIYVFNIYMGTLMSYVKIDNEDWFVI